MKKLLLILLTSLIAGSNVFAAEPTSATTPTTPAAQEASAEPKTLYQFIKKNYTWKEVFLKSAGVSLAAFGVIALCCKMPSPPFGTDSRNQIKSFKHFALMSADAVYCLTILCTIMGSFTVGASAAIIAALALGKGARNGIRKVCCAKKPKEQMQELKNLSIQE